MNEKIELIIPEGWNEINLAKFVEFSGYKWSEMTKSESMIQQTSILLDIDPDTVEKFKISQLKEIYDNLTWCNSEPSLNNMDIITIGEVEYGFIPSMNDISVGEWIDLETLLTENSVSNLPRIFALLYRPITKKVNTTYEIEEYDSSKLQSRSELFAEKLSICDIYGSFIFFYLFGKELSQLYLDSLSKKELELMEIMKEKQRLKELSD